MDRLLEIEKKVETIEKKVAELEQQLAEQPDVEKIVHNISKVIRQQLTAASCDIALKV